MELGVKSRSFEPLVRTLWESSGLGNWMCGASACRLWQVVWRPSLASQTWMCRSVVSFEILRSVYRLILWLFHVQIAFSCCVLTWYWPRTSVQHFSSQQSHSKSE